MLLVLLRRLSHSEIQAAIARSVIFFGEELFIRAMASRSTGLVW